MSAIKQEPSAQIIAKHFANYGMVSIQELSSDATTYEWSTNTSFKLWVRVATRLLREARVYQLEGDISNAFVLFVRYTDLVLNKLPRHPNYDAQKASPLQRLALSALNSAEKLKTELLDGERLPKADQIELEDASPSATNMQSSNYSIGSQKIPSDELNLDLGEGLSVLRSLNNGKIIPHAKSDPLRASAKIDYAIPTIAPSQPQNIPRVDKVLSSRDTSGVTVVQDAKTRSDAQIKASAKGLRRLIVPSRLQQTFLQVAIANTRANIETCGILAGKLNRNAFFVTDLIIPEQTGTADTCATDNEEALFDYVDKKDLFVLGWIHTHPRQSCFMSSVDLHTHASYQLMLPESVALVCAPNRDPSFGAFHLTIPDGIETIKRCTGTGFHSHSESNIYELALPGHISLVNYDFEVKDLRPK